MLYFIHLIKKDPNEFKFKKISLNGLEKNNKEEIIEKNFSNKDEKKKKNTKTVTRGLEIADRDHRNYLKNKKLLNKNKERSCFVEEEFCYIF